MPERRQKANAHRRRRNILWFFSWRCSLFLYVYTYICVCVCVSLGIGWAKCLVKWKYLGKIFASASMATICVFQQGTDWKCLECHLEMLSVQLVLCSRWMQFAWNWICSAVCGAIKAAALRPSSGSLFYELSAKCSSKYAWRAANKATAMATPSAMSCDVLQCPLAAA